MKKKLVIATGNPGKVDEFRNILGDENFEFLTLKDIGFTDEIIEDADTFAGNALLKARAVASACDHAVLADDSGLEVEALGGAPGIYTARFAGPNATDQENLNKLLKDISREENRQARFFCALAFIDGQTEEVFEGWVSGEITRNPMGNQGFGYDPIFQPQGEARTFAQMTHAEKKQLSHRGMAIKKFKAFLEG